MDFQALPVIDISALLCDASQRRVEDAAHVVDAIRAACCQVGFFYVTGALLRALE